MSKHDGTNIENVASREPDGLWACCLCSGWKNRACDDKDYEYNDRAISRHLRVEHNVKTTTLMNTYWPMVVSNQRY